MGRILFFDLDGTIWDREEKIPAAAARSLERARQRGHLAVVNTGRTRVFALRPSLREIGLDGMVTGCGTRIELKRPGSAALSFGEGEAQVLYDRRLDAGTLEELIPRLEGHGFRVLLEGPEYMYADMEAFRGDPYMRSVAERSAGTLLDLKANRGRWRASKMTFDMRLSPDRERVLGALSAEWNLFRHNGDVCELVPPGHDKAAGLRRVCALLGADEADTVAFGDGTNDADMLRAAGSGVAMGGAAPEALSAADMVTGTPEEDGIGGALRRLGLI